MTTTQESITKAQLRALSQGVKVLVLEPGLRYAVPSFSDSGTAYEVRIHPGIDPSFNCRAGQNGRACKHVGAVMLRLEVEGRLAVAQPEAAQERSLEDKFADLYQ